MKAIFNNIELTSEDWDMFIEGVENLKSKDIAGELMGGMLEAMMLSPREDATPEEKAKWEERKRIQNMERQLRRDKRKEFSKELDVLKAKLILIKENDLQHK